jgi:hypothetical protein
MTTVPTNSVTRNSCQGCMYTDDRNKALTNVDVQWTIDFSTGSISVCRSMTKLLTQHFPILNSLFLILTTSTDRPSRLTEPDT